MKRSVILLIAIHLFIFYSSHVLYGQEEIEIWKEFVSLMKENKITPDHIRPHQFITKESLMEVLNTFRRGAVWEEWEVEPEVVHYNNIVNFLIPLKGKFGERRDYCFTFLIEEGKWYLQHIEAIFIRLDKISSLPASEFPDIPESQKAWARQELYWSKIVWLYNDLSAKEGKESALRIVRDGAGYFLAAKAWVPFVPPSRAFILYVCWEQANLRGNDVVLEKLEDNEAVVKINPLFFQIYRHAGHLKQQIPFEDYRRIFETLWHDRVKNAGWDLQIIYRGVQCFLHFKRQ